MEGHGGDQRNAVASTPRLGDRRSIRRELTSEVPPAEMATTVPVMRQAGWPGPNLVWLERGDAAPHAAGALKGGAARVLVGGRDRMPACSALVLSLRGTAAGSPGMRAAISQVPRSAGLTSRAWLLGVGQVEPCAGGLEGQAKYSDHDEGAAGHRPCTGGARRSACRLVETAVGVVRCVAISMRAPCRQAGSCSRAERGPLRVNGASSAVGAVVELAPSGACRRALSDRGREQIARFRGRCEVAREARRLSMGPRLSVASQQGRRARRCPDRTASRRAGAAASAALSRSGVPAGTANEQLHVRKPCLNSLVWRLANFIIERPDVAFSADGG